MDQDLILLNEIDPKPVGIMQFGFLFIALCEQGEGQFTIGGHRQTVSPGCLLINLGEQVWADSQASKDFKGKAVLMSRSYAQDCVAGLDYLWPYLLYVIEHPVIQLSEKEMAWVNDCYKLLRTRLLKAPGHYLRETVIALTRAFYLEVCNLLDKRCPRQDSKKSRSYSIFDQFIRCLSQNFKRERSVEWYSNELCLTPKHLSGVVKSVSGRTAGQWITALVMSEAKSLLRNTNLSIKEIAQEMNFPNQSFLGKYFKNAEGISPSDFRKRILRQAR